MVATGQDCGNVAAPKRRRPGVLRILEESVGERFLVRRGVVDRARQQADDGIDDDEGGRLPTGQDVVADRQFEIDEVADAVVDALVARTHQDQVRSRCEIVGPLVAKGLSSRVEQDDERIRATNLVESGGDRFGSHDHPGSAAVRRVVDAAMPPESPLAEVVGPDRDEAPLLDPSGDAGPERPGDHLREERQDVDLEGHRPSGLG